MCEGVIEGEESLSITLVGSRKCRSKVLGCSHVETLKRHSQPLGRHRGFFPKGGMAKVRRILKHADPRKPRHEWEVIE
jgi:hypothetical protein